jgi:S1-C subfamily serine protease
LTIVFLVDIGQKEYLNEKEQVKIDEVDKIGKGEKEGKEVILFPEEEAVIQVVEDASPAVVSIIATKELYKRGEMGEREVGWGSGFIVFTDGYIITNRHVVENEEVEYTIILNDGREFIAEVLARDKVRDLAILKIQVEEPLPVVALGNSDNLRAGQTTIAIGNMLGKFQNSVSRGIISGLGRTVTARGRGLVVRIDDVIQTDATINPGNSGGPLLNLRGEVIGINTATEIGIENIGFAIPINQAREALQEIKAYGRIIHPFLGIKHIPITRRIQREYNLPVAYGSWVSTGRVNESAIFPGSGAEKAGIKDGDIILKINQEKITPQNLLAQIIIRYNPGDEITLTILRDGEEITLKAILGEMK